ncbi:hypothetical protein NHX12_026170, partial [Muraenolepis orangiensis]
NGRQHGSPEAPGAMERARRKDDGPRSGAFGDEPLGVSTGGRKTGALGGYADRKLETRGHDIRASRFPSCCHRSNLPHRCCFCRYADERRQSS